MSGMVDRVETAMHEAVALLDPIERAHPCWGAMARAAISTLQEPTEAMLSAGYDNGYGVICHLEPEAVKSLFKRAFDAALKEDQ